MTSDIGVWEHARYTMPRVEHGYCTDDNARALIVVCREPDPDTGLVEMAEIYFRFLAEAGIPGGGFHNRRGADGSWTDVVGSDDSQGRAIWSLGSTVRIGPVATMRERALELFEQHLGFASPSPRANAFAALGAAELLMTLPDHAGATAALEAWIGQVDIDGDPSWPWPESRLAYDNARIPEAMIAAGGVLDSTGLVDRGLRTLDWLVSTETNGDRFSFSPASGWAPGEPRPGFDQQPVEAAAMADACSRAWAVTGEARWREGVLRAARWLLGVNDSAAVLYDAETGGCRDGLTPTGANQNMGAESTLAAIATLQDAGRFVRQ